MQGSGRGAKQARVAKAEWDSLDPQPVVRQANIDLYPTRKVPAFRPGQTLFELDLQRVEGTMVAQRD